MDKNEKKELEELRQEVANLRELNSQLVTATQMLVERNVDLYERLDVYNFVRAHAEWLKEMVHKHREVVAHADLRDVDVAVRHRDHAQVLLLLRLAGRRELGDGAKRSGLRALRVLEQ